MEPTFHKAVKLIKNNKVEGLSLPGRFKIPLPTSPEALDSAHTSQTHRKGWKGPVPHLYCLHCATAQNKQVTTTSEQAEAD